MIESEISKIMLDRDIYDRSEISKIMLESEISKIMLESEILT